MRVTTNFQKYISIFSNKIIKLLSKAPIENISIVNIAQSTANFRDIQGRVTYTEGFAPVRYFISFP